MATTRTPARPVIVDTPSGARYLNAFLFVTLLWTMLSFAGDENIGMSFLLYMMPVLAIAIITAVWMYNRKGEDVESTDSSQ